MGKGMQNPYLVQSCLLMQCHYGRSVALQPGIYKAASAMHDDFQNRGQRCLKRVAFAMWLQVRYAELTTSLGYDVLMLDADLVLLRPCLHHLQSIPADVIHSEDVPGALFSVFGTWDEHA